MNPLKGEIELIAAGKSYVLRFSIDAICSLEERLGKGFPAIAAEMQDPAKMTIGMVRQLLHASLQERHPDIALKEAGEMIISAGGMVSVLERVSEAIAAAFPTSEASGTKRPTRKASGRTGLAS